MRFREFLKRHTPWPLRQMSRRVRRLPRQLKDKRRNIKEVFTEIYAQNIWGERGLHQDKQFPFYSGPGSGETAGRPYADFVNSFIDANGIKTAIDLGCGDFRVGSRLARPSIHYIGIDVVETLIKANRKRFGSDTIEFRCLDIIADQLPGGDLCLVREVLQHLTNSEIAVILSKLEVFKWVIVTECQPGPPGSFKPNKDKPHGDQIRALWNSGVVLNAPPFNISNITLVLDIPIPEERPGTRISTFLIRN